VSGTGGFAELILALLEFPDSNLADLLLPLDFPLIKLDLSSILSIDIPTMSVTSSFISLLVISLFFAPTDFDLLLCCVSL
jgi:hypothetical protein